MQKTRAFVTFVYGTSCKVILQGYHQEAGAGDFPRLPWTWPPATFKENRRKIEPKEIPSCLIPHLLVIFTEQHEMFVTTLYTSS